MYSSTYLKKKLILKLVITSSGNTSQITLCVFPAFRIVGNISIFLLSNLAVANVKIVKVARVGNYSKMVVGAFPAAKLGSLLLKQISKPIANVVKAQAKNSPVFRKYVCMPPAQFYNWCEIKAKMWILNLGKPVNIPVLNEQMAIDLGANLLGEGIIFLIAAGILINEYTRSYRKEAAKEEKRIQEMELLQRTVQELFFAHEKQATQIRELTRVIYDLEGRVVQKPWVPKKNKDEGTPPSPPPVIVSEPILTLEEVETIGSENLEKQETLMQEMANTSLLMKAVNELEEDLFQSDNRTTRDVGIVTTALNFLYKDVYRLQLTM